MPSVSRYRPWPSNRASPRSTAFFVAQTPTTCGGITSAGLAAAGRKNRQAITATRTIRRLTSAMTRTRRSAERRADGVVVNRAVRHRGDNVSNTDDPAGDDPGPQTTLALKEFQYGHMRSFRKQATRFAQLQPFE